MIRRILASTVFAGFAIAAVAQEAPKPTPRIVAIVAPVANTFYEAVGAGCRERAAALGPFECRFLAATPEGDHSQAAILKNLLAEKPAGIAVSPTLLSEVVPVLVAARAAGIPVVAFDSDLPADVRDAFVGSDARDFGRALGRGLERWKPDGGRYAVLTGDASSLVLADRLDGLRDVLGQKWTEIGGSPVVTTGEAREAAGLVDRILLQNADVDAVVSLGAWPFLADEAWREIAGRHKERLERARTVLIVADALPSERRIVRDGLGHALVGQRPGEMGARLAEVLIARAQGRPTPEIVYTGFDLLTRRELMDRAP